jgi:hypothetical protein
MTVQRRSGAPPNRVGSYTAYAHKDYSIANNNNNSSGIWLTRKDGYLINQTIDIVPYPIFQRT